MDDEEKQWLITEDELASMIKNKKINLSTSNRIWSSTLLAVMIVGALMVGFGILLIATLILFLPLIIIFLPIIWLETRAKRSKEEEYVYEDSHEREDDGALADNQLHSH